MTMPIIAPNARKQAKSPVGKAFMNTTCLGRGFFLTTLTVLIFGLLAGSSAGSNDPAVGKSERTMAGASGSTRSDAIDFSHKKHVPESWLFKQDEVRRDCRGCHDFSAEDPADWPAPTEVCASCHGFGSFEIQGTSKIDPAKAFPGHAWHNQVNCSTCHEPDNDDSEIPKYMPVPASGANDCKGCHERNGVPIPNMGEFNTGLTEMFAEREKNRGDAPPRFLHSQHLSTDQMADGQSCQRCHTDIATSDSRNLGENQFNPKVCSECHTAEYEVETYQRPSKTAAAFWHEYHLGSKAMRIEEKLSGQRCVACHKYDDEVDNYRLDEAVFPPGRDTHDGCVSCHEHQEWKVEKHGQTDECAQCHAIQGGSLADMGSMATNRPRKLVLRPRPIGFQFGAHSHALITANANGALDQDCAECHRAVVPELPSMLTSRPFDHNSHLSANLGEITAATCKKCHSEIERESLARLSKRAAEAHQPDAELSSIFDDESCAKCHGEQFETVFPEDRLREVMFFSHNEHLKRKHPKTGKRFDCLHCHVEPTDGGAFSVRVPEEIQNCTQCHNHEEYFEQTAGIKLSEVGSCVECHRDSPIPERGVPVQVERLRVAGKLGIETHDRGGVCTDCHKMSPPGDRLMKTVPTARNVRAVRKFHIHRKAFPEWDPKNRYFNRDGPGDQWCVDCHWQSQTHQFRRESEFKDEPYYEKGLTATKLRKAVGDNLTGFPGFAE